MTNKITFTIDLTETSLETLSNVMTLLATGNNTCNAGENSEVQVEKSEVKEGVSTSSHGLTMTDLKKAASEAKSKNSLKFVHDAMDVIGIKPEKALGRRLAAVPLEAYPTLIASLKAIPEAMEDVMPLEGDVELAEKLIDPAEVVAKLREYNAEHGRDKTKKIMAAGKASALSKVAECSQEQLSTILKGMEEEVEDDDDF